MEMASLESVRCSAAPVAEVIYGAQFRPLPFTVTTPGRLASLFASRYPIEEQAPRLPIVLEVPPGNRRLPSLPFTVGAAPAPRLLLLDSLRTTLLQIQSDRFHHNWRKVAGNEYPSFEELLPVFVARWSEFKGHLRSVLRHQPGPIQYELTYVNHIEQGPLWQPGQSPVGVLPWVSPRSIGAQGPIEVEVAVHQVLPELRGRLHAVARTGVRNSDGRPVLVFELTVRGTPARLLNDADIEKWFAAGHSALLNAFVTLTSAEAHSTWGLRRAGVA